MRRILVVMVVMGLVGSACGRNPTLRYEMKKSIEGQTTAGISSFRRGEYQTALLFFQEALKQAYQLYLPQEIVRQYAFLAEVSLRMTNLQQAFGYWQAGEKIARQEGISSFDLWLVKARYFQMRKDANEAMVCYKTALRLTRTSTEKILASIYYADFFLEQQKPSEARRILNEAGFSLWFFSDYDVLGFYHYYSGLVALEEKNYDEALREFRKALVYDQKAENIQGIVKDLMQILDVYRVKNESVQVSYYEELLKKLLDKNEVSR